MRLLSKSLAPCQCSTAPACRTIVGPPSPETHRSSHVMDCESTGLWTVSPRLTRSVERREARGPGRGENSRSRCRDAVTGSVPRVTATRGARRHEGENTVAKYLLLKHYRGAPASVNNVPMDKWT